MSAFKIRELYPDVFEKIEFKNNSWWKVNQTKENRELNQEKVQEFILKNWPKLLNDFKLEELRNELIIYNDTKARSLELKNGGWGNYQNETEFIVDMNRKHNLFDVNASGIVTHKSGKTKLLPRLRLLASDYHRESCVPKNQRLKDKSLSDAFDVYVDDVANKKLQGLKDQIKFDPNLKTNFDELLDAMRVSENREIHEAAIKHYMWQIKRKLWRREVKFHLMLILYCKKQGFGKSGFFDQFHTPLKEVYAKISGDRIQDKFSADLFDKYFVANFDEMAQFGKNGIAILKEFVTRNTFVSRKMFSDINVESKQNTTMCGTTNRPINQIIYDASGMRRWWQINVDEDNFSKMDFEKLDIWESDCFLKFWRSIDESNDIGFYNPDLPLYKIMLDYQDEYRAILPVEQFLMDCDYSKEYLKVSKENRNVKEIDLWSMWTEWKGWCHGTKNNSYTLENFKSQLDGLGYEIKSSRPVNKETGSRNRIQFVTVDNNEDKLEANITRPNKLFNNLAKNYDESGDCDYSPVLTEEEYKNMK